MFHFCFQGHCGKEASSMCQHCPRNYINVSFKTVVDMTKFTVFRICMQCLVNISKVPDYANFTLQVEFWACNLIEIVILLNKWYDVSLLTTNISY